MLGFRVAYDYHPSKNHNEATVGYFSYKNAHFDMLFSPMDLLAGLNMDRFFRLYLYGGMGVMGYDVEGGKVFITNSSALELGLDGGIINSFRLSRSLDFHIDLQATITRWSFDEFQNPYRYRVHTDLEAMAGLTWYLGGRTFEVANLADGQVAAVDCTEQENTINELNGRIRTLEDQLANSGNGIITHDTIVKIVNGEAQVITYPLSIFFNKGSYELRDGRDRVNLEEFANAAKANGYKIILRGTCDSATASSAFNMTLAENRCNMVKQELIKLGVPESNITINPVGGVEELNPTEYDRRVLIQLSK
jgi:outer membrane protein OmpA-like peptidoglycan-associated protein